MTGRGGEVGNCVVGTPVGEQAISFTGSTAGGITVSRHALGSVKRISLELGGKSPFVLLPGCKEYTEAIRLCFNSIFLNSGQTCTAYSRLLVPQAEKAAVEKMLVKIAAEYTMGDPLAENVKLGPLASAAQFKKVKGFIEQGLSRRGKAPLWRCSGRRKGVLSGLQFLQK